MSAALQLTAVWGAGNPNPAWKQPQMSREEPAPVVQAPESAAESRPAVTLGAYRQHTEKMLRRYLYASMQIGRSPSLLSDPVSRGWASSRPIRTFEDAVIFVLDMESCLSHLGSLDRDMLGRIVLQEYTQAETASLLGMSVRSVSNKFPEALDRLTKKLLETGLLVLPH